MLSLLEHFVPYMPYCLHDEIFSVFDKLLDICREMLRPHSIEKIIETFINKYTMKSKANKASLGFLVKILLEP